MDIRKMFQKMKEMKTVIEEKKNVIEFHVPVNEDTIKFIVIFKSKFGSIMKNTSSMLISDFERLSCSGEELENFFYGELTK